METTVDLREFIRDTLVQIQAGVRDAIEEQTRNGAPGAINPVWGTSGSDANEEHVQKVEFDVAVTVGSKAEGGGRAGIKVFSAVEASADGKKSSEESTVTRIKFAIPVIPAATIIQPTLDH